MTRQVVSRSQRRMEKKQALILLVLVLGVSLASFSLGVMVGRSSRRPPAAQAAVPVRLPVAAKAPGHTAGAGAATADSGKPSDKLTFYDTLTKGDQAPLGSGINLPPKPKASKQEPQQAPKQKAAAPAPRPVATAKAAAAPAASARPAPRPAPPVVARGGSRVVQAASFRTPGAAGALKAKLEKKGYGAFVQKADLGSKGTWYRVMVGPYDSAGAAARAASQLKAEYRLSAIVRKR